MPRPREFDQDEVLARAMAVFWRHGYAATSLDQIDRATGLQRGSIYNAFTDKRGLFLACLDHYGAREIGAAVTLLSTPAPAPRRIAALFRAAVEAVEKGADRRGCLLCNTAVELAPHDPLVEEKVVEHLGTLRTAFQRALKAGPPKHSARDIARLADQLTATYMGLHVMAKAGFPVSHLRRIARGATALLKSD